MNLWIRHKLNKSVCKLHANESVCKFEFTWPLGSCSYHEIRSVHGRWLWCCCNPGNPSGGKRPIRFSPRRIRRSCRRWRANPPTFPSARIPVRSVKVPRGAGRCAPFLNRPLHHSQPPNSNCWTASVCPRLETRWMIWSFPSIWTPN